MPVMNDSQLTDQVINLIAKHALCKPEKLSVDTRLGEDLRIVGDDAGELLTEFSTTFNVDMSNMDFDNYFPSEATADMHYYLAQLAKNNCINPVMASIKGLEVKFWRLFSKKKKYQTLTIEDLMNIVNNGKW